MVLGPGIEYWSDYPPGFFGLIAPYRQRAVARNYCLEQLAIGGQLSRLKFGI